MTMQTIKSSTQDQNPPSSPGDQHSGIRNYRLTAVCLGLLTVLLLIIITALSIHYSCPQGWIKFSSSCYYISNDRKTWNESRQNCREREADLVIINNKEKQMFISKFHNFWIGLTDSNKEGNWKWVDGTTLITGYWIDGQPDNEDNEDCVVTYGQKNPEATWNDLTCSCTAHWLCEKPASR
ncbi:hypothetical protein AGOR_G00188900 [Albula goreensis]|uniref:C-type lectin domain-containing protein n=1 Tax=Albula goreensis TaxID=1534307 RepID=A0A8T3CQD1_9TELE|nr:hypothetical protein AGOR_G00188900 [Albula goreensis]